MQSELVGYIRKPPTGNHLKLVISAKAFDEAEKYQAQNGEEFVYLTLNTTRIQEIIDGQREVTSICHTPTKEE